MKGDKLMARRPWCDCTRKRQVQVLGARQAMTVGYTRRDDGAYVRPCCMRRDRLSWEKHGDKPVEHNPLSCSICKERIEQNHGSPISSNSELTV